MQTLKGIFFPFVTWHTICVAASSLQELGTSFKAFIRLKSNAAITPSLLHKYPRSGMQNAPVSVARWQCYQSDTLPKSWLFISPMCGWQDGKSSIFFVKKEKKKTLKYQATEELQKHYWFCNIYHGNLSRL